MESTNGYASLLRLSFTNMGHNRQECSALITPLSKHLPTLKYNA